MAIDKLHHAFHGSEDPAALDITCRLQALRPEVLHVRDDGHPLYPPNQQRRQGLKEGRWAIDEDDVRTYAAQQPRAKKRPRNYEGKIVKRQTGGTALSARIEWNTQHGHPSHELGEAAARRELMELHGDSVEIDI